MNTPFAIWTMRRTGGTTLTDLLMTLSEHREIEHEPFNSDRVFGPVSSGWYDHRNTARTAADLDGILKDCPLIKHCFEIHGRAFNQLLLEALKRAGYRQIVLRRENEVARILSLELAKLTGVWGKMGSEQGYARFSEMPETDRVFDVAAAQTHMEDCFARWTWLAAQMQALEITPHPLRFEDLYSSVESGKATVQALFDFLDFPPETTTEQAKKIEHALRYKGQDSKSMMSLVGNIDRARASLQTRLNALRSGRLM